MERIFSNPWTNTIIAIVLMVFGIVFWIMFGILKEMWVIVFPLTINLFQLIHFIIITRYSGRYKNKSW